MVCFGGEGKVKFSFEFINHMRTAQCEIFFFCDEQILEVTMHKIEASAGSAAIASVLGQGQSDTCLSEYMLSHTLSDTCLSKYMFTYSRNDTCFSQYTFSYTQNDTCLSYVHTMRCWRLHDGVGYGGIMVVMLGIISDCVCNCWSYIICVALFCHTTLLC